MLHIPVFALVDIKWKLPVKTAIVYFADWFESNILLVSNKKVNFVPLLNRR